eukprot:UN15596
MVPVLSLDTSIQYHLTHRYDWYGISSMRQHLIVFLASSETIQIITVCFIIILIIISIAIISIACIIYDMDITAIVVSMKRWIQFDQQLFYF